ncbi:SH3 domain-containing protein [Azospirillum doebereinerae]|uniref:SH3 domain-containing protein n=1 Tax=Azospirillum doebereinerae TaxID=92933 RepID=A0A433J2E3_9PROT|nr:SH3 domain-containing protein [Azospirillum doebereinerae]RUQ65864.1 SH3 domain-containing protein [Azospirillum doebereinerae]
MIRPAHLVPLALALTTLLVPGCTTRERIPNPPDVRSAPSGGTGLEKVYGEWEADKPTSLLAQPTPGGGVVATIGAGQAVTVLGRVRNSDWIAVKAAGSTAYVRLHLLRLKGSTPAGTRGTTTTISKPADNAGPSIKAAPRGKVGATAIPG